VSLRDWGKAKFDDVQKREAFVRQCLKPFDNLFKSSFPGIGNIPRDVDPLIESLRKEQGRQKRT